MNRIRGYHVQYPAKLPDVPTPIPTGSIETALIAGTPTREIMEALDVTNEAVQQAKRRLRKQGRL